MMGDVRSCKKQFCFLEGYAAVNKMINIYAYINLLTNSCICCCYDGIKKLWAAAIIEIVTQ